MTIIPATPPEQKPEQKQKKPKPKKKKKSTKKKGRLIDHLPIKHKDFLLHYLALGKNGRKAYLKVYPNVTNGSAYVESHRMLKKPKVRAALLEILDEMWAKKEEEISAVFNNLVKVASSDVADYIDEDGEVRVSEFNEIDTYPLAEYQQTKKGVTLKLHDKMKALSELTKILGMIQEKVEHTGTIEIVPAARPEDGEE